MIRRLFARGPETALPGRFDVIVVHDGIRDENALSDSFPFFDGDGGVRAISDRDGDFPVIGWVAIIIGIDDADPIGKAQTSFDAKRAANEKEQHFPLWHFHFDPGWQKCRAPHGDFSSFRHEKVVTSRTCGRAFRQLDGSGVFPTNNFKGTFHMILSQHKDIVEPE